MIVGIFDKKLFVIDNALDVARTLRIWTKPSNWFRNDYGMLIPHGKSEGISGWDLKDAIGAIGKRLDDDENANTLGFALIGEDFCTIHQVKVKSIKHLPHLKSDEPLYYPIFSRITNTRNQLEFVQVGHALANLHWGPSHNHTNFDDYVNDVYRRSLCNKYYAEYGQIYTIEIDSLKTCLELQAQGKFKDIDALWTCRPTTKLKLTEINMEDLRPFNWASIEMM